MTNPIIRSESLDNFNIFSKKPTVGVDNQLVMVNEKGQYKVFKSTKTISRGELMTGKYQRLFEVSMLPVKISHHNDYLSLDMVHSFVVDMNARCYIIDSVNVVKNGIIDIKKNVIEIIDHVLKSDLEINKIDDYRELKDRILYFENKVNNELEEYGLELRKFSLSFRPDESFLKAEKQRIENEKKRAMEKDKIDTDIFVARENHEFEKMKVNQSSELEGVKSRLKLQQRDEKLKTIIKYAKSGEEEFIPFLLEDEPEIYKLYTDCMDKKRQNGIEDFERMLNLAKEFDYDISELIAIRSNPEKATQYYYESNSPNQAIDHEDNFIPQGLDDDDDN